jgi:hypothetical protein
MVEFRFRVFGFGRKNVLRKVLIYFYGIVDRLHTSAIEFGREKEDRIYHFKPSKHKGD